MNDIPTIEINLLANLNTTSTDKALPRIVVSQSSEQYEVTQPRDILIIAIVYLEMRLNTPPKKSHIASLLWQESMEHDRISSKSKAYANLDRALHKLRVELKDNQIGDIFEGSKRGVLAISSHFSITGDVQNMLDYPAISRDHMHNMRKPARDILVDYEYIFQEYFLQQNVKKDIKNLQKWLKYIRDKFRKSLFSEQPVRRIGTILNEKFQLLKESKKERQNLYTTFLQELTLNFQNIRFNLNHLRYFSLISLLEPPQGENAELVSLKALRILGYPPLDDDIDTVLEQFFELDCFDITDSQTDKPTKDIKISIALHTFIKDGLLADNFNEYILSLIKACYKLNTEYAHQQILYLIGKYKNHLSEQLENIDFFNNVIRSVLAEGHTLISQGKPKRISDTIELLQDNLSYLPEDRLSKLDTNKLTHLFTIYSYSLERNEKKMQAYELLTGKTLFFGQTLQVHAASPLHQTLLLSLELQLYPDSASEESILIPAQETINTIKDILPSKRVQQNYWTLAEAYSTRGHYYYKIKEYSKAHIQFHQAQEPWQQAGMKDRLWGNITNEATCFDLIGKFEQAEQLYNRVVEATKGVSQQQYIRSLVNKTNMVAQAIYHKGIYNERRIIELDKRLKELTSFIPDDTVSEDLKIDILMLNANINLYRENLELARKSFQKIKDITVHQPEKLHFYINAAIEIQLIDEQVYDCIYLLDQLHPYPHLTEQFVPRYHKLFKTLMDKHQDTGEYQELKAIFMEFSKQYPL